MNEFATGVALGAILMFTCLGALVDDRLKLGNMAAQLKAVCEGELPRNQACMMLYVPEEINNEDS